MSFGGGYQGGRTRMTTKVYVNVYDLSPMNDCLYPMGVGLHHTGVEILGSEYSFASGAGIFEAPPRMTGPGAVFREQIEMGAFDGGPAELKRIIADMQADFKADGDYNLIHKNCNHFANALCWRLLRKSVPGHVNRLSSIGAFCACLLPRALLENAPVGDPNNAAANNNGGGGGGNSESKSFLMFAPPGRQASSTSTSSGSTTAVFSGTGARLGGLSMTSTPSTTPIDRGSTGNGSSGNDLLTDRRERARKAALARLEQNSSQTQQQQQHQQGASN
jgi:deubiquitinase DESI2